MSNRRMKNLGNIRRCRIWERGVVCLVLSSSLILGGIMEYDFVSYATADTSPLTSTEATTESASTQSSDAPADASVEQARKDKEDASAKKEEAQKELNILKDIKSGIEDKIVQLDLSITTLQAQITELEMSQEKLQKSIKETQEKLQEAKAAEQEQYERMKERIQMVYESGNKGYLDVLLTATSMTDIMNKVEYTNQVSLYDYNLLKGLQEVRGTVASLESKLKMDLETNTELQTKANLEKENMEDLVEKKSEQVEEYNASIEVQQDEVAKYERAVAEAESIILAAERAAMENYSSDGSEYTGGAFTWPVPGSYSITSYFGNRTSPVPGASSNHKGIDIACNAGDPVVAAASGTVIVATYNYAEGNYVAIDHGGGVVTLYMHNSSLVVTTGQYVEAGETVAYAGSTGISSGPHCHFGVRVGGSYVDPLSYLQ